MTEPEGVQMTPFSEEVIRQAAFGVQKINTPDGPVTLLQFITPVKAYTFSLDDGAAEKLSNLVKPTRVVPASALDLQRLAP